MSVSILCIVASRVLTIFGAVNHSLLFRRPHQGQRNIKLEGAHQARTTMKKAIRILCYALAVLLLLFVALIQRIDRTPFRETAHYAAWKEQISKADLMGDTGSIQVSWATQNITPLTPVPMAGYGNRWGAHFEAVRDSVYVKVIAIKSPETTLFLVAADMLVVPPNLTNRLASLLSAEGIGIDQVHIGTTHTHHSLGGWGKKLTGRLFSGKFDPEVEERLAMQFRDAIVRSQQDFVEADAFYAQVENEDNIRFRLDVEGGTIDPWIRSVVFRRTDGKRAKLLTYAAHPTTLRSRLLEISRDFPGVVVDSLESQDADIALYMAGAVGSMGARGEGETPMERMANIGQNIVKRYRSSQTEPVPHEGLASAYWKIPLPEPTARISQNLALRPWVFRTFFGDYPVFVKVSKIGHILMLGMPADFSGEIMRELDEYADSKGIELILTSFNGGYIGYITPDRLYDETLYETVTMSWNGFQAGGYFTQLAKDIIDLASDAERAQAPEEPALPE